MQDQSSHLRVSHGSSTRFGGSALAEMRAAAAKREQRRSRPTGNPSEPLRAYAERWLATVEGAVRPRTYESYTLQMRLHVLPQLGDIPIGELDEDDLVELIAELRRAGYTAWTIRTTLTPLSRMLNHAVRRGVIPVSPMSRLDRTERPAVWASEQKILSRDDIGRLLDGAPPRFRTLLAAAIFLGLRQGELLGLRWQDIDFEQGIVKVRQSLDRHGQLVNPKTRHAVRDVVMMPALARMFEQHRSASTFPAAGDYVFASQRGTPFHWRNVARRALQPALSNAGLSHRRWHDLRHSYASLLISQGSSVVFVSRQLGHGSPDITLRVYGHLLDRAEHAQRTRDALEQSFGALL